MTANGKIVCKGKFAEPMEIGSYLTRANLEVLIYQKTEFCLTTGSTYCRCRWESYKAALDGAYGVLALVPHREVSVQQTQDTKVRECEVMYTLLLTLPSTRFSGNSCGLMFQEIGCTVAIAEQPHQPKWKGHTIHVPGPLYVTSFRQGLLVLAPHEPKEADTVLLLVRGALSSLTKDNALMLPSDENTGNSIPSCIQWSSIGSSHPSCLITVKVMGTESTMKVKFMEETRTGSEAPEHHCKGVMAGHHHWITTFFNKRKHQGCHARAPKSKPCWYVWTWANVQYLRRLNQQDL